MEVNLSELSLTDLADFVEVDFRPIANEKKLDFNILLKEALPRFIYSDESITTSVEKPVIKCL